MLTPPVTHEQLRLIIRALEWKPSGYRHNGCSGRPAPTYPIGELQRLHAALTRWLA